MTALKARVENGRLVLNEPTDLPEGTELELVPANEVDDGSIDIPEGERRAMEEAIHEGLADLEAGRSVSTADLIAEIRANT